MKRAAGPKGKADRLCSLLVRSRGACQRCGGTNNLQAAHIIGRRYSATRTDETNIWCLDAKCHLYLTEHPYEHMLFVEQTIGMAAFFVLRAKALGNPRPWKQAMWEAECVRLQALLDETMPHFGHGGGVA